jgi:hypothetical protein
MPDAPGELEPEGGASYTPGTPGGLVPEGGGAATPGDPGNLTPSTPAAPSAPPSISPETPPLPAQPENYARSNASNVSPYALQWREAIGADPLYSTAGGPPSVGTFSKGDSVATQTGEMWRCYEGGTPGFWVQVGNENKIQIGPGSQKKDWHGVVRYPGKIASSGLGIGAPNRMYAAPYPLDEDSAISSVRFEILAGSVDAGASLDVAIYDDHKGMPGKLLWSDNVAHTTGRKVLDVDPVVPGGRWLWITFTIRDTPTDAGSIAAIDYHPYELQGGVENYYISSAYNAVSLYANDVSEPLPVRYPKFIDHVLYDNKFPLVSFNLKANPNRTDPRRHEPDRVPVMLPLEGESACQEPCMHYFPDRAAGRRYVFWFSAGWSGGQTIVWADGPSPDGPWTRRGSFGVGGRGNVYAEGGIVYHYMSPNSGTPGGGIVCRYGATPEAIEACTPVTVLSGLQAETPNLSAPYQNTGIAKRGTGDYVMMFESIDSLDNPTVFQTGYATGDNPLGPFTAQEWPVTSLRQTITNSPAAGHVSAGQPIWDPVSELFRMYYHAGDYVNTPSEIFHATSPDCETWTVDPLWRVRREHPWEYDQVADPFYFKDPVSGKEYLFWDAIDNEAGRGCIMRSNPNKMTIEL